MIRHSVKQNFKYTIKAPETRKITIFYINRHSDIKQIYNHIVYHIIPSKLCIHSQQQIKQIIFALHSTKKQNIHKEKKRQMQMIEEMLQAIHAHRPQTMSFLKFLADALLLFLCLLVNPPHSKLNKYQAWISLG